MPRHRGTRRTIAPYVYEDEKGIEAVAYVTGRKPRSKRFPLGTALGTIDAWQRHTKREMAKEAADVKTAVPRGTFGGIIADYLATIQSAKQRQTAAAELQPWVQAIGARPLSVLARAESRRRFLLELQGVMNGWLEAGVSASLATHRRRQFAKAWDLALPDHANLVRRLPRPPQPRGEDRGFDVRVMDAILDEIPDRPTGPHPTKARLKVYLWAGIPPSTQARLRRHAIDLTRGEYRRPPRRKGEGTDGALVPLYPEGVAAFRLWIRARAYRGTVDKSRLYRAFRAAFRRYRRRMRQQHQSVPLPDDLHPHDLRHSFLTWCAEKPGMTPDVLMLLGDHLTYETTMRYIRAASQRLAARMVRGQNGAKDFSSDAVDTERRAETRGAQRPRDMPRKIARSR